MGIGLPPVPQVALGPGATRWERAGRTGNPGAAESVLCPPNLTTLGGQEGRPLRFRFGGPTSPAVPATQNGPGFTLEHGGIWCTGGFTGDGMALLCQRRAHPGQVCGGTYFPRRP
jgi:hypothetical protein